MLLHELLYRLQNFNTWLLFWDIFAGLKFLNELNMKSSLSLIKFSIPLSHRISIQPPHGNSTRCSPYVTLIKPSSLLKVTHRSFRHASAHLWNQYITQNSSSQLLIPLSATFIWTCRFNLLHTAITYHFLTVSLKLKNYLFRKSYPSR